jgi:GNAT superfamily N-acetyltransferase
MSSTVKLLDTSDDREIGRAFAVFTYLRPHLDCATFVQRVHAQRAEGYKIVCLERDGQIVSAAGYRVASFLAWGRVLYVDDLVTHPERKRLGLGGALLDWLIEESTRLECDEIHLDTGFARHDAHRLYLNKGFKLSCHHMSLPCAKGSSTESAGIAKS